MARTKQKLIHYHGSVKEKLQASDLNLGEIAVVHSGVDSSLLATKVNDTEIAFFATSGAVEAAINAAVSDVEGQISAATESLSGSVSALSASVHTKFGQYATSANVESAISTAKSGAVADAKEYTDGEISALTDTVNQNYTDLDSRINSVSGSVSSLTKNLTDNYATSANTKSAIENAEKAASGYAVSARDEAIASAKSYTDTEIDTAKTEINQTIGEVSDEVGNVNKAVTALTKNLTDNYATSADTVSAIKDAKDAAISAATQAKEDAIDSAKTYTDKQISAATNTINQKIGELSDDIEAVSGSVSALSANVVTYVDNKLSAVYKYAGSVNTIDGLPTDLTKGDVGIVYNVVESQGTLGEEDYVPAGTNYAWDGEKWDALGGVVDLSSYAKNDDLSTLSGSVQTIETDLSQLSSATQTLFGDVDNKFKNYATSADTKSAIENAEKAASGYAVSAKNEAIASANDYTDTEVGNVANDLSDLSATTQTFSGAVDTKFGQYATSAATESAINAVQAAAAAAIVSAKTEAIAAAETYTDIQISGVTDSLNSLSGATSSIETNLSSVSGVAVTAVQQVVFGTIDESGATEHHGAKIIRKGNNITIDLDGLIIDCGEF